MDEIIASDPAKHSVSTTNDAAAYPYCVMAHEMLHLALMENDIDPDAQHQAMQDNGYLNHASDFIAAMLGVPKNGAYKKEILKELKFCIESDKIYERRHERESLR